VLSESMENYLKVIFEVLEHEDRAATSTIAERMGIAAPSVTAIPSPARRWPSRS
jgi:Mn-dependent DtxR family transcriptional regulator